jgi:hypothetical protein
MLIEQVMRMANAALPETAGKISEIDTLTSHLNRLTDAVDFWNRWMVWGLVIAAVAATWVVLATRLTIVRSKQVSVVVESAQCAGRNTSSLRGFLKRPHPKAIDSHRGRLKRSVDVFAKLLDCSTINGW